MPCPVPKVGGALFAVMVQILLSITRVAPCPVPKVGGTSLIGAGKLSRYWMFVRSTGPPAGGSRYKLSRS